MATKKSAKPAAKTAAKKPVAKKAAPKTKAAAKPVPVKKAAVKAAANAEMDEAVKFADESPYPDPSEVTDDMYTADNERCVAR